MRAEQVSIIAPDPVQHREALFDFYAKVFSDRMYTDFTYYEAIAFSRRAYFTNSHYDWNASRIGVLDGQIVSHYGVWDYQTRIGSARVRTGGIGSVATHGDLRKQGLMGRTARAALEAMRAQGYDLTILFGIENFYHRFGYVHAWPEVNISIDTADLSSAPPASPLRQFTPGRRPDLAELYNTHHATLTGTAVRPTFRTPMSLRHGLLAGYLWFDGEERPAGYVVVRRRGHWLRCVEHCGDAEQGLRVLAKLARQWHCSEVQLHTLPYESPLCRLARRGNHRVEINCCRTGGPMVHVLNLAATLHALTGELSQRLSRSHLKAWQGKLLVADGREQVTLALANGKVKIAPTAQTRHSIRGGNELAQLLIGTDDPIEVAEAGGIELSGDAAMLLPVLFPTQYPQLSEADRY